MDKLYLFELAQKLSELKELVKIDNVTDNPMVDAYNNGVDAMSSQIASWINAVVSAGVESNG
jgi:hypothetical protein